MLLNFYPGSGSSELELLSRFWKQRAGDSATWRKRLNKVVLQMGDCTGSSMLLDDDDEPDTDDQDHTRKWGGDRPDVMGGGGGGDLVPVPGSMVPAWHQERAALVRKYEVESDKLRNQVENLQKELVGGK